MPNINYSRVKKSVDKTHKSSSILERAGHELKANPPSVLSKTKKKKGAKAAEAQRKAILLSKARRAGANI